MALAFTPTFHCACRAVSEAARFVPADYWGIVFNRTVCAASTFKMSSHTETIGGAITNQDPVFCGPCYKLIISFLPQYVTAWEQKQRFGR